MGTSNSAATSYATPTDMLDHYDVRPIADLLSDTNIRLGGSPNPDPATVIASPRLQKILNAAAGMIEAATLRSLRYSVEDLATNLDGVSKEFLVQINCDLAMGLLYRRRPDKGQVPPFFTAALQWLESLANGDRVFSLVENEAASIAFSEVMTANQTLEQAWTAQQAGRYFGWTADLLNPYMGGLFGPGGCGGCD